MDLALDLRFRDDCPIETIAMGKAYERRQVMCGGRNSLRAIWKIRQPIEILVNSPSIATPICISDLHPRRKVFGSNQCNTTTSFSPHNQYISDNE